MVIKNEEYIKQYAERMSNNEPINTPVFEYYPILSIVSFLSTTMNYKKNYNQLIHLIYENMVLKTKFYVYI